MKKKRKIEQPPEYLYHYTSRFHAMWIEEDGFLRLTPSNLLPHDEATATTITDNKRGIVSYWDKNADYKQVVWMTTKNIPDAQSLGLYDRKCEVRYKIKWSDDFCKWDVFASKNKMDKAWRKALESERNSRSWYISERPVILEQEVVEIAFKRVLPDGTTEYIKAGE